jgi:hypothetical protein
MEVAEARKMVVRGSVRAHQASAQDEALPIVGLESTNMSKSTKYFL